MDCAGNPGNYYENGRIAFSDEQQGVGDIVLKGYGIALVSDSNLSSNKHHTVQGATRFKLV